MKSLIGVPWTKYARKEIFNASETYKELDLSLLRANDFHELKAFAGSERIMIAYKRKFISEYFFLQMGLKFESLSSLVNFSYFNESFGWLH